MIYLVIVIHALLKFIFLTDINIFSGFFFACFMKQNLILLINVFSVISLPFEQVQPLLFFKPYCSEKKLTLISLKYESQIWNRDSQIFIYYLFKR